MTDPTATPPAAEPAAEPTLKELQDRARELEVSGRSSMDKDALAAAIAEAEEAQADPSQRPGTPDEVGRPPLVEVAERSILERGPVKVIGEPHESYEDFDPATDRLAPEGAPTPPPADTAAGSTDSEG